MKNRFHRRAKQNTATVIRFLGKSNADAAVQVMWRDIKPEKMEAAIRRGGVLKLQGMEALMWTKQGISWMQWT